MTVTIKQKNGYTQCFLLNDQGFVIKQVPESKVLEMEKNGDLEKVVRL